MNRLEIAVLLVVSLASAFGSPGARAAPPSPPAPTARPAVARASATPVDSELVRAGIVAYEDLDYPHCVELLETALGESLTRAEKIVAYKTLGFCHAALDQTDAAKFAFANLLRLDENFELDRRVSPRIRVPFEEAKAAIATGQNLEGPKGEVLYQTPTVTPEVSPPRPKEGQALTLMVAFSDGAKAQLFYRTRGQAVFSKALSDGKRGHFAVTVPGLHVQAPGVEYYLVLLDDRGAAVARAGALGQPLSVDVQASKRPVYKRGWFWGVIGGVAAVGAIAGVAAALATAGPSKNAAATVTIQPQ